MTALELFVTHHVFWGYAIVFAGMFIEGESFFLTASILAEQGYFRWGLLITVAFCGIILGDILFYFLGRHAETSRLGRWLYAKFLRSEWALDRHFVRHYPRLAFISKFVYFVNRVTPFLAGWYRVPPSQFLRIHFVADSLWLTVMVLVSQPLSLLVNLVGVKHVLRWFGLVFVALVILALTIEHFLSKRFSRKLKEAEEKEDHSR